MLKTDRNSCVPNRHRWRRPSRGDITPAHIAKVLVDLLVTFLGLNWMTVTLLICALVIVGAFRGLWHLSDLGLHDLFGLLPLLLAIWVTVGMYLGLIPLMTAFMWMTRWADRKVWGERPRQASSSVDITPGVVDRWMRASVRGAVRFQIWLGWVGLTCFMLSVAPVAVEFFSQVVLSSFGLDIRYGIAAYAAWVVVTAWALFMWCLRLHQAATDRIPV